MKRSILFLIAALILFPAFILISLWGRAGEELSNDFVIIERSPEIPAQPTLHPVYIRKPDGPPRVATNEIGFDGQPATASCMTCHATRKPDAQIRQASDLDEFHQSLHFQHGNLSCLSCHNADDYDTLRLTDGAKVEYSEVMQLCSQCHGTQYRDYQNGAHGGMSGYWSREHGPRYRNNCIDCHDPHAPAYAGMVPVPHSKDRFLPEGKSDH